MKDVIPALLLNPQALATAPTTRGRIDHDHNLNTIVGFVVRQSIEDGERLPDMAPHRPGRDIAVVPGVTSYSTAVELAGHVRGREGSWAVVDRVYTCGCRT